MGSRVKSNYLTYGLADELKGSIPFQATNTRGEGGSAWDVYAWKLAHKSARQ